MVAKVNQLFIILGNEILCWIQQWSGLEPYYIKRKLIPSYYQVPTFLCTILEQEFFKTNMHDITI